VFTFLIVARGSEEGRIRDLKTLRVISVAALQLLAVAGIPVQHATIAVLQSTPSQESRAQVVAFTNVNVIPIDRERVLHDQTVIVRDGHIATIGPTARAAVPPDALIVNSRDKYLIPGLADMHTHVFGEKEYLLYVAKGVTTIRNMWGFPSDLEWRAKIAKGEKLGPTIYTAGSIIDGNPPQLRGSTAIDKPEEADRIVKAQKEAGYDFIKVYNRLKPDVYDAIVDAANKYGIRVVGHVPLAVGLEHAIARKQASIEHLMGYPEVVKADGTPPPGDWSSRFDEKKMRAIAKSTRKAGAWNCPTLVVQIKLEMSPAEVEAFFSQPEFRYVPPQLRRMSPAPSKDDKPLDPGTRRRGENNRSRMVKLLHDAGARLLLGTDTGNPYLIPGISAHEELKLLVAAGLSPYDALRAGTKDAAEFLNGLEEFGTISVGKRADMILLDDNPLKRIENSALISGVMVRGRWLPQTDIRKMLDEQAASYSNKK
jgi:imidazolonepropionase-like amidohydrolase